jgi:hypothetical protein
MGWSWYHENYPYCIHRADITVAEPLFSLTQDLYLFSSRAQLQRSHAQPQHCLRSGATRNRASRDLGRAWFSISSPSASPLLHVSTNTEIHEQGQLPCRLCALHEKQCTFLEAAQPRKRPIPDDEGAVFSPTSTHTNGPPHSISGSAHSPIPLRPSH